MTDADTLIVNPEIAIHDLLPSPDALDPPPLILGNQDFNGFNAGVIIFRVSKDLVDFLVRTLAAEIELVDIAGGSELSDQTLLNHAFQTFHDVAARFYEIPYRWLNAYHQEFDESANAKEPGPLLQLHLVSDSKYVVDYVRHLRHAEEVYMEAARLDQNVTKGLQTMAKRKRVTEFAEEYWRDAKGGVEGVRWLDD